MKKYHIVYRTENLINGKIYYGAHSTDDIDDGYLGSGRALVKTVSKYGRKAFKRQMLGIFLTAKEMFDYERKIVSEEAVKDRNTYNQRVGGNGDRPVVSQEARDKMSRANKGKIVSEETRRKLSEAAKKRVYSLETRQKMSKAGKERKRKPLSEETKLKIKIHHTGKKLPEETKLKMSKSRTGVPLSDYHKQRISEGHQRRKKSPELTED